MLQGNVRWSNAQTSELFTPTLLVPPLPHEQLVHLCNPQECHLVATETNGSFLPMEMETETDSQWIPNLIDTLYYAQLFPLVWRWRQRWRQRLFLMVTVPILGMDLCPRDRSPSQFYYILIRGLESVSIPVEKPTYYKNPFGNRSPSPSPLVEISHKACMVPSGWYASYWNAFSFLFFYSDKKFYSR